MIDWFARNTCVDIVTTKSIELRPNPGNREPILTEPRPGSYGNAVGLKNPGVDVAAQQLHELRSYWTVKPPPNVPLINVSLSASCAEDFGELARRLGDVADLFELNFSCPHAASGYGAAIGSDPVAVSDIAAFVVAATARPVFVKLTPNVESIAVTARAAVDAGAHGIVAINTVGPDRYIEPHTGRSVLSNPPDGRGGRSGRWIHDAAVKAITDIRQELGPDLPVIGMGGVDSRAAFAAMHDAGADAVGIGSALGSYHQDDWPRFFRHLSQPAETTTAVAEGGVRVNEPTPGAGQAPASSRAPGAGILNRTHVARMDFTPFPVGRVERRASDMCEIVLDGTLEVGPGQAVFIWLPGVGEKPFAPATADPLTFLVREKGSFTRALAQVQPGQTIYLRGPYGDRLDPERLGDRTRVVIVAAGTGLAAVSILAMELLRNGVSVEILLGVRETGAPPLAGNSELAAATRIIPDDGEEGRVIDVFEQVVGGEAVAENGKVEGPCTDVLVITAGPDPFMERVAAVARRAGVAESSVLMALERTMMCGVGICGACDCGGRLTCQYGTFVSAADLSDAFTTASGARQVVRGLAP